MLSKYKLFAVIAATLVIVRFYGQDQIPETSGFSGFMLTGPGIFNISSNLLSTGPPLAGDAGDKQIESIYNSPESNLVGSWAVAGEVNYTFAKSRTQLFFGNRLEDILRLDVPFGLGVRQGKKKAGILAFSFLLTPLELKFWEDPYIEGEERTRTDLNFNGLRFRWGEMCQTGLEFTATVRIYQHYSEKSGEWLIQQGRLDPEKKQLLKRDGEVIRLQALYRINIKRHRFEPTLRYIFDNHEGGAIANQGYTVKLTYLYMTRKIVLDANLLYGARSFRETNPIYNEKLNTNKVDIALTGFIPIKVINDHRILVWFSAEYFQENANIDFYKSQFSALMAGIMYRHNRK